jgi:hypothetical protein
MVVVVVVVGSLLICTPHFQPLGSPLLGACLQENVVFGRGRGRGRRASLHPSRRELRVLFATVYVTIVVCPSGLLIPVPVE